MQMFMNYLLVVVKHINSKYYVCNKFVKINNSICVCINISKLKILIDIYLDCRHILVFNFFKIYLSLKIHIIFNYK